MGTGGGIAGTRVLSKPWEWAMGSLGACTKKD